MHCSGTRHVSTTLLLSLSLLLICAALSAQSFSHILSFQGRLAEPDSGKPYADGLYEVTFTIYDAEADGSALWQETQDVTVSGGLFRVHLGSVTPFPGDLFADGDRWLAVQVTGDVEIPERIQFTPAPWAIYAANTQPDDDWSFSGADIYREAGNVGIGTAGPGYPLHVEGIGTRTVYARNDAAHGDALFASSNGTAVRAYGGSCGLNAYTDSPTGYAAYAFNEAESGSAYAFYGENASPSGIAIYGLADNGSEYSTGIGVFGRSDGDYGGTGVYGEATNTGTTYGVRGVSAHGTGVRGEQTDSGNYGVLGRDKYGVEGYGGTAGAYFGDSGDSGHAYLGYGHRGMEAYGNYAGGYFRDTDSTAKTYIARGDLGVDAEGSEAGGYFEDSDGSGEAYLGYGDHGIEARGSHAGGYFEDTDESCYAYVGCAGDGISASGWYAGGFFEDLTGSGWAFVGYGNRGIEAKGSETGGHFADTNSSGYAYVAHGDLGIDAEGGEAGGYFGDTDGSGEAYVGYGDRGIEAKGGEAGGYFEETDGSSYAYLAYGDHGIKAYGTHAGGRFEDADHSGAAVLGVGNFGIKAVGDDMGGEFWDNTSALWSQVAFETHKIFSTGSCDFVQNHPEDPGAVVVYACPEGDEVATYTRGTAQLQNGVARVQLGETYKWVTNPDIGLTAHLTPRGCGTVLYVGSLTTSEMVVRSMEGFPDDVVFDYIVYGLRIGFEEVAVVQEKTREAYIPSMASHRERYQEYPELRKFNALERFRRMRAAAGEAGDVDLTASRELRDSIVEFDPAIHAIDTPVE